MEAGSEVLEQELRRDLEGAGWVADAKSAGELYRALANNAWGREGLPGRLALSWARAEALVNDLLRRSGGEPATLAQTGGEGEISEDVRAELERLGWRARPLNTNEEDRAHLGLPESPPPRDAGEREAPVDDSSAWANAAHAEAEEERRRKQR